MSRSALWRQEAGVKEREIHAQEVFQNAVEEGRNVRTKGLVPLYGPDDSFHLHPMLFSCIVQAPYFTKCCNELKDWNAIVDEIYYEVKHVEPWAAGGKFRCKNKAYILLIVSLMEIAIHIISQQVSQDKIRFQFFISSTM
jgi:PRP38 family